MAGKIRKYKKGLSETLSLRVSPSTKRDLATCARLRGTSMERIANEIMVDFFSSPEWKRRGAWRLIERATYIIEEKEKEARSKKRGQSYEE